LKFLSHLVLFVFLFSLCQLFGQKRIADSLVALLDKMTPVQKVDAYNRLSDIYVNINTKTSIEYAGKGIELAKEINYEFGEAGCYGSLGYGYLTTDNEKAAEYTSKALEIRQRINDKPGIATSLNVMGILYYYMGNYLESMDYHMKAVKMREEIGDFNKIAASYNNIALVHIAMGNYENALEYLQKALELNIKNGKTRNATIVDNIGDVYSKMGKFDKAVEYFQKSLKMSQEAGYKKTEANSYFNFAKLYYKTKDYNNAFKNFDLALDIYSSINEVNGIANTENGFATTYLEIKNYDQALKHALTGYEKARAINALENVSIAADIIRECYSQMKDYKKAYEYLEIFHNTYDSLKSGEKMKRLAKIEFDYKMDKIKKVQEAELSRQNTFIIALIITISLLIIIGTLIIWAYRQKRNSNAQLSVLNKQLQELISTKDKFFSIIAHDLKSPFQGLMGFSDILITENDELNEEQKSDIINAISKLSSDTYKMLENLLQWSKLQTGKIELVRESFNLNEALAVSIDILSQTAKNKNIIIENLIDKSLNITADQNMIQTTIRNLISNAVKFTNLSGEISIFAKQTNASIEITVKDNGIGMNKTTADNIFKIEHNTSRRGTANEEGTGLGLLLCKEMIELHNGSIKVESVEGKGSAFTVILPKN
jgi:signal transduction histidine kinase/Tfp pilus assembly protein PilF